MSLPQKGFRTAKRAKFATPSLAPPARELRFPPSKKSGSSVKNGKEPKHKVHKGAQRQEDTLP
jgi:hypothetical protein